MSKYTSLMPWELCNKLDTKDDLIEKLKAQLETANADKITLIRHVAEGLQTQRELEAQLAEIAEWTEYANNQADSAQIRLLNPDKPLYDDTYWQPVLDKIRFELFQILNREKK